MIPALLLVGALLLLVLLAGIVDRVRSANGEEARAFAGMHGIDATAEGIELCRRYLSRARRFRFLFSLAGLLASAIIERYGISLLTVVPAWFVGVMATELFRLRRPGRAGPAARTASLARRSPRRYVPPALAWHSRIAAAATVVLATTALLLPWHGSAAVLLVLGGAALAVLATAEGCQHAVAARTRPALPPALERADDAIRKVGAQAVGYAASGGLSAIFGICCLSVFRIARRPAFVHGMRSLVSHGPPPYVGGTFAALGLILLGWAVTLGVTEHRFFWPRLPRAGWRWRRRTGA